jgi:hypothetical protein
VSGDERCFVELDARLLVAETFGGRRGPGEVTFQPLLAG